MTMAAIAGPKPPGTKYGQPVPPNLNVRQICPNCKADPPNIIEEYSKGDLVCGDCGTILGDRIVDTRSEWRTFAGDEGGDDPSRVGDAGNPLLGTNSLDTIISGRDGNTGLSKELSRAQARVANTNLNGSKGGSTAAQLSAVFGRIAEKCDQMQLPQSIVQRAQHVYKIADENKAVKSKNEATTVAACIIFACRGTAGSERTFQDVMRAMKVSKKELFQALNSVKAAVQVDQRKNGARHNTTGQANLESIVEGALRRMTNQLGLDNRIYNAAKHIAVVAVDKTEIVGRSPTSVANGVLYFTVTLFEESTTAKDIEGLGGVSQSTIKLICKMIATKLDDVIRPEWKEQYPSGYANLAALGKTNTNTQSRAGTPRGGGTPAPADNGDAASDKAAE